MTSPVFPSTRWTVVRRAGGRADGDARAAFADLCRAYWYPLYAFQRRRGSSPEEAADLVQGLFTSLLEHESLERVTEEGARFRAWLLAALRHHAGDERERANAAKRGGGQPPIPIDAAVGEGRYGLEPEGGEEPEALFEREWARDVMANALDRLAQEYVGSGRGALYDVLSPVLSSEAEFDRAAAGRAVGLSATALRVSIHRLRGRYRHHLLQEVRSTLDGEMETGEEVRLLLAALDGAGKPVP